MLRFTSGLFLVSCHAAEMWMVPQVKHEYVAPSAKTVSIMQTNRSDPTPAQYVSAHNAQRCLYSAQEVTWNAAAAANAQAAAENCVTQGQMVHSASYQSTPQAGENIYASASSVTAPTVSAVTAVDAWVSEVSNCPDDGSGCQNADSSCTPSNSNAYCQVGHFTAVVWKDTSQIGCGVAKATSPVDGWYWTYVVCQYAASYGNVQGQYPGNVGIYADGSCSDSPPSPTPAPAPSPTPSSGAPSPSPPDDNEPDIPCVDMSPSGIRWQDGTMATCAELGSKYNGYFCTTYTFVADRCPASCGTCGTALQQQSSEVFTIPKEPAQVGRVTKFSDQISAHIAAGGELDLMTEP